MPTDAPSTEPEPSEPPPARSELAPSVDIETRRAQERADLRARMAELDDEESAESRDMTIGDVVIVREGRRVDTAAGMPALAGVAGVVARSVAGADGVGRAVHVDFSVFDTHGVSWGDAPAGWLRPASRDETVRLLTDYPLALGRIDAIEPRGVSMGARREVERERARRLEARSEPL